MAVLVDLVRQRKAPLRLSQWFGDDPGFCTGECKLIGWWYKMIRRKLRMGVINIGWGSLYIGRYLHPASVLHRKGVKHGIPE